MGLSLFSLVVTNAEAVRMTAIRTRMNRLLESLSADYKEITIDQFAKNKLLLATNRWRITKTTSGLYLAFMVGAVVECIVILCGYFW
jgi:hypothetical protein